MSQYGQRDGLSQLSQMMRESPAVSDRRAPIDPDRRRRRRRRGGIIAGIAVLLVVALVGGYVYWALNAPVGAAASTATTPQVASPAAVAYVLPGAGEAAISVTGAEDDMGAPADGILTSSGGNAALPIASISKLVTAMVILDHKPLGASGNGPTITFDKTDHALYDKYYVLNATIAAMPTNSSMSEKDALETMLVVSACNYAEAMALWAFGSDAAFLSATKSWLAKHAMTSTKMYEPTGLDSRNVSTPTDLITLGKLAMANPAVAAMVGTAVLQVPNVPPTRNTNELLGNDGINGIKTGTLDGFGANLLFSAVVPAATGKNLTMIGVVLGGSTRSSADTSVTALIDSITAGFHQVPLGTAGQVVGTYSTPWGSHAKMVLKSTSQVLTWSNTPITSALTTTTLKTGADGSQVGAITWTAGARKVSDQVVLQGAITPPTSEWRLTHPGELLKLGGAARG